MKFIVNSSILPTEIGAMTCNTEIPKKLKDAGINDVSVITCYCCSEDDKVVFEADASSKDALAEALTKINFPVDSIMETEKRQTPKIDT